VPNFIFFYLLRMLNAGRYYKVLPSQLDFKWAK
jgi:hypothetical protein